MFGKVRKNVLIHKNRGYKRMNERVKNILKNITSSCQNILKENLIGIYIHGSIAFECFNWDKSDIDFIIVTKETPSLEEKEYIIKTLLEIDKQCPSKGLEMSLVLERYCKNFVYPTPYELHYSNIYKEKFMTQLQEYCRTMNGVDNDLAAHFTVIKEVGITFWGKDKQLVFGAVPKVYYIDSIKKDIENSERDIFEDPVYIILNLCRVLAYINNNIIISKKQVKQWAAENSPTKYINIINEAVDSYCSNRVFSADIDKHILREFAIYMHKQIFRIGGDLGE